MCLWGWVVQAGLLAAFFGLPPPIISSPRFHRASSGDRGLWGGGGGSWVGVGGGGYYHWLRPPLVPLVHLLLPEREEA